MNTLPSEALLTRRIILLRLHRPTLEVLLDFEGAHRTLPRLQIARGKRVAEQLTAAFRETYGNEVVSVSSFEARPPESGSDPIVYEMMELCGQHRDAGDEKKFVAVDSLIERDFDDRNDFQAVQKAAVQIIAAVEDSPVGPFARVGWFGELEQWVQEEIRPQGLCLNGRFRQFNAGPAFSLIRFETDGPAVWFKAVGAPNQREYRITLSLARLSAHSLPVVIAARAEWDGWLSRETEGPLLKECSAYEAWEAAARDLTQLQIRSLGRSANLLDAGARDLRSSALADLVEPFLQTMGELMERQCKMPPARLSPAQLRVLAARVCDALAVLDETGIPATLGHLDLNPGNIVCSPVGCVFLDWAEAFVGHPFITFEYLREHFRRRFGQNHLEEVQVVDRYLSPWRAFAEESYLRRALEAAPLVAVFAYAVGNGVWTDPRRLEDSRTAGYLRGLTRRMGREACGLPDRSLSCPD